MCLILLYVENFVVKKLSIISLSAFMIILFTIGFAPYLTQDAFAQPEPIETPCYPATLELDQNQYFLSDYYYITLVAPNENHDSDAVETASISYWEVGKSKGAMALEETGFDTGIFTTGGANDRLSPYQVSKHVESAPTQFMISFNDVCTAGITIQVVAEILPDDGPVVESESEPVIEPIQEYEHDPVPIPNPPLPAPSEIDIKIAFGSSVPGCEQSNSCFTPSSLSVDAGETITWYNADTAAHAVTSGTPSGGPDGIFDSSLLEAGSVFSVTLTQPGTYTYFSMMHPWAIGEIVVQGSGTSSSDTTPPQVIVPSDMTIDAGTDDYVTLEYDVKAIDDVDGVITPTCNLGSGTVFAVGQLASVVVTCTATDSAGNTGSASFILAITSSSDSSLPRVIVPSDMTIAAGITGYAILEYSVTAIDDVDGAITPTCNLSSGFPASVGEWLVACTATDSAGNTGYNRFMVTVIPSSDTTPPDTTSPDTTPPQVIVPSDMTLYSGTSGYATLEYDVKTIDDVDGVITPTCDVGSGTVLYVRQWYSGLVTCTATDSAGNTGSASFMVSIESTPSLYSNVRSTFGDYPEYFVVPVIIDDPDIQDTYEPQGEPDVTVNGKILRMAQTTSGKWYGFFADIDTAKWADSTDLDFGVFCSGNTNTSVLGVDFSDTEGVAVPRDGGLSGYSNGIDSFAECTGSVNDSILLNNVFSFDGDLSTNSGIITGQIGLDSDAWPIIQLYDFTDGEAVQIQYNKGEVVVHTRTLIHNTEPSSSEPNPSVPRVTTSGDMIIDAGTDDYVILEYDVRAYDYFEGVITTTCDVESGTVISVVSVEQLLVTCTATDGEGNTGSASFMVTITSTPEPTPEVAPEPVPIESEPEPTGSVGIRIDSSVPDQTGQNTFEDTLDNTQEQIDNDISNPPSQDDDLSELIDENRTLREELERQGEQIDELSQEVDLLKQIIQNIQGFFSRIFG